MIVLDASAALELLLNTETGKRVANSISNPESTLHVPHLIDLEILQTLRRYVFSGDLTLTRATLAIEHWQELTITRYPHEPFMSDIWRYRDNLSAYDAAYVALAGVLEATLITCDSGLSGAPNNNVDIKLFSS